MRPLLHASRTGAVVPAAGAGVRMGGGVPKQLRAVGGVPVLVRAVRALVGSGAVGPVAVAAPADAVEAVRALLAAHGLDAAVVAGGATRAASVRLAMEALPPEAEVVLVHDAARPFVPEDVVRRVADAAWAHGAAAAALPVADTLRRAAGDTLDATVDRDGLWAMQTPQGARRDLLAAAYAHADAHGAPAATDEAGLLLAAGTPVQIVTGDARAFKLTTPSDAVLADALAGAGMRDEGMRGDSLRPAPAQEPHPPSPIPYLLSPILAIETSCDDTAVAVWADGRLASSVVAGQEVHALWGGVVPELASRDHQRLIGPAIGKALSDAGIALADVGAVAVTYGPGLAGSLLVGLSVAKGIALGLGVPLVGVNHLDGHVYSVFVGGDGPAFPFLCLTVSGGHTHLTLVREGFRHETLGHTRDDAAGEAFDKVAKLLGLPYPGGPHVDRLAATGDATWLRLPSPRLVGKHDSARLGRERPLFDVSFSGLKTAVRYWLDAVPEAEREAVLAAHRADVCASFQATVVGALTEAVREAVARTGVREVAVVGGVSANRGLREAMARAAASDGFALHVPDARFSVDNAAMIAVAAAHKLAAGETSGLDLRAEPHIAL